MAAHRGGIDTVLIPHENETDLTEIPKNIKQNLSILPVRWIDEVLDVALSEIPEMEAATPEEEGPVEAKESGSASKTQKKKRSGVRTHH